VGIHDNFFTLGGDSILSIQIISRARRAGLKLEPRHLAEFPTIASLATIAEADTPPFVAATPDSDSVPLSPIQVWFFSLNLPAPHHWNQSAFFDLTANCDSSLVDAALRALLATHPQLRARFSRSNDGEWTQSIAPLPESSILQTQHCDPSKSESLEESCFNAQASLNLTTGPLLRAIRFVTPEHQPDHLLIAVHHLVVDAVSWQIIIDDLTQALIEPTTPLPPVSISYGQWTQRLRQTAKTATIKADLPFWQNVLDGPSSLTAPPPPSPHTTGRITDRFNPHA
jgi:aryl carrier-like protein